MQLKGRILNKGYAEGEAVVLDSAFSFIGDFDTATGELTIDGHPLFGVSIANCILVIPTGKGGTIAPFMAYEAKKNGKAPAAILCNEVEPLTAECAMTIDIPLMDAFGDDVTKVIETGDFVKVNANSGVVEIVDAV